MFGRKKRAGKNNKQPGGSRAGLPRPSQPVREDSMLDISNPLNPLSPLNPINTMPDSVSPPSHDAGSSHGCDSSSSSYDSGSSGSDSGGGGGCDSGGSSGGGGGD